MAAICSYSTIAGAQVSLPGALDSSACPNARSIAVTRVDSMPPARTALPRADVVVLAFIQAAEVRFSAQPRISVRVCGDLDSARIVARRNLPDPIVVGETYRDVLIAVELLGHLKVADSSAARRPPP